jgi:NADPH:quinone reductase-like Zn-dependent oxidoreductase
VYATVRNEKLRDQVAGLGATVLAPEEFADHGPFDVILELVGAPNMPDNLKALNTLGRIMIIGIGAGAKAEVHLGALMGKRGRIFASTIRPRPLEEKAMAARAFERSVLPHLASGAVKVPVAETFGLDQAEAAYDRFTAGGKLGKIVLTM